MKILYVGDIMGEPGIETVEQVLPKLVKEQGVDLVVAQAENVSDGKGLVRADFERLKATGVHVFTGGNHTMNRSETLELLQDESLPITYPANYPDSIPGTTAYKTVEVQGKLVLVVSLLGSIVGKHANDPMLNPLKCIDEIFNSDEARAADIKIVNFHGDYSSEKVVIGHYLDGRATAVIGDHWHVPTADARVLPGGTAHITDVGMCGARDSSLGVKYENIIARWRDNIPLANELEVSGQQQFNAVLIETNQGNNLAASIRQIQKIL